MNATPTLTDRLARYRPTLDAAIEARTRTLDLTPRSEPRTLEEAAFDPVDGPHRRHRGSMVVIGAAAAVAVGGLTVITFNRPESDGTPAGPATAEGAPPPEATVDTVPTATTPANGASRPCDASVGDPPVPAGTLYLGAPANDQNLARPGAIFALPEGTPAVDVAARAVGLAVIGYDCNVTATAAGKGNVLVSIDPPASSTFVSLMVRLAEIDDAVAVTAIAGSTRFETDVVEGRATLTFRQPFPAGTAHVQVRFKKGDDVWELTADPSPNLPIELQVPAGETDRFPDEPVDWVLFTALDNSDLLLDAGGEVVTERTAPTKPAGAMVLDDLPAPLADATGYSFAGSPAATPLTFPSAVPIQRWYTATMDRPELQPHLKVVTMSKSDPTSQIPPEGVDADPVPIRNAVGWLYDDPSTSGRTIMFTLDGTVITVTGYQLTDEALITAAEHTNLAADGVGAKIDPAGLSAGLIERAVGVTDGVFVSLDDAGNGRPSVRWFNARPDGMPPQDGEPMLWLAWSVDEPDLFPLHRLDYDTVIDTTVRDAPAFIATSDPAEHLTVWWSEGGYTYVLGGFGLDQDTVIEAARQLRSATDTDWAKLEVEPG